MISRHRSSRPPAPRVLVTGGTGFVGRHTVAALREAGARLRLVGRPDSLSSLEPAFETRATHDLFAEGADWWRDACADVDIVLHIAWYAVPGKYLMAEQNLDCLAGTLALAKGAAQAGVARFVGVGTCFEYDLSDSDKDLTVDAPLQPLTPYAAAKVSAYHVLSQWLPRQDVEFLWGRLFYLYGDGEPENRLVPHLHRQLSLGRPVDLTSGTQVRDFMDVKDAGALLADAALSETTGPFNVCSGIGVTVRALAEAIADQYGRRDLLNFGARPDNLFDPPRVVGTPTPIRIRGGG